MNKPHSAYSTNNPNVVDHLQHPLAQRIRALLSREERSIAKEIIIDDEENIIQALKTNVQIKQIFTTDREQISAELKKYIKGDIQIIDLSKRTSKKLFAHEKLSRIFALADMPKLLTLADLKAIHGDYIALDKLTISGNIGAIMRTSVALGMGAVVLIDSEPVDIYDRRVIRASRGYVFNIPVITLSTQEFISFCRNQHIPMLVTTSHAEKTIEEVIQVKTKLVIIFGSEKEGCSKELDQAATLKAKIPIQKTVESLNVSVAASIILYLRYLCSRDYQLIKTNLQSPGDHL